MYFHRIAHGPRARLRLLLNGVPFYRVVPEEDGASHAGSSDHLLRAGENVVTLEVERTEEQWGIMFEINVDLDHKSPVVYFEWPKIWKGLPEPRKRVPFTHTVRFQLPGFEFEPVYLSAPPAEFGCEGTAELREAVRRYHDVTARGDTEGFIAEIELQLAEMHRCYGAHPAFDVDSLRSMMNERFAAGVRTRPLDFREIHFESFVEGRVAHVTGFDGRAALQAASNNGDSMEADLWLTQHRGQWRVFR